jgi:hypothetical protein
MNRRMYVQEKPESVRLFFRRHNPVTNGQDAFAPLLRTPPRMVKAVQKLLFSEGPIPQVAPKYDEQ